MAENFEEQYLLMVTPYETNSAGYYPSSHPKGGQLIPVEPIKNADAWEKAVRADIRKISQTKVGSLLLRSIKHHGKVVTIRPYAGKDCNARTWDGDVIGKIDKAQTVTGADIAFSPEIYDHGGMCETKDLRMGGFRHDSHETLLHELVHAFRQVSGKMNLFPPKLGKGLSFYGSHEEFNAVLVQGIYASERRTPIRGSHFGYTEIAKEYNGSLKFFKTSSEAFKYVEKFCLENPGFTKGFININTRFNPISAYYQDRDLARQFSRSVFAKQGDYFTPIIKSTVNFLKKNL